MVKFGLYVAVGAFIIPNFLALRLVPVPEPEWKPDDGANPESEPGPQHDTSESISVHWYTIQDENFGHFRYYRDFKDALEKHPNVHTCEGSFVKCKSSTALILAHGSTTKAKIFKADHDGVMRALNTNQLKNTTKLIIFLNKEYVEWEEKLSLITNLARAFPKTVILTHSPMAREWSKEYKLHFVFVPFAVKFTDFDLHEKLVPFGKRKHDLYFSGDLNPEKYVLRKEIVEAFPEMSKQGIDIQYDGTGIHASPDFSSVFGFSLESDENDFVPEGSYKNFILDSKMVFSTIGMGPGSPTGSRRLLNLIGTRYFEIMASGTTLLLCERASDSTYAQLGIKEDVNAVMFSNVGEFIDKVQYYRDSKHAEAAMKIISSARDLVRSNHTWDHRAQQVVDELHSLQ